MTPEEMSAEIAALRADLAAVESALVVANDAAFGIAGIVCRILVEAELVDRKSLADALDARAGREGDTNFNAPLRAFARSLRMILPGGRFELIPGGKTDPLDCG